MTSEQTRLVQQTFELIAPKAHVAALLFYQRLFTLDPSLRALFQNDIEQQGVKLMQALRFAVAAIDRPLELEPVLESLGRRHVYYGVQESHYETLGDALLATLESLLGSAFTPEVKEAWRAIYTLMTDTMKRAAAKISSEGVIG